MKCPFCQQELVIPKEEIRNGIQCCVCRNPKCEFDGWHFPVKLVQELIHTRKALDVAVDTLDAGKTLARIAGFEMLAKGMDAAVEQINEITKGETNAN